MEKPSSRWCIHFSHRPPITGKKQHQLNIATITINVAVTVNVFRAA